MSWSRTNATIRKDVDDAVCRVLRNCGLNARYEDDALVIETHGDALGRLTEQFCWQVDEEVRRCADAT